MPEKTETLHRQPYQQLTANRTFERLGDVVVAAAGWFAGKVLYERVFDGVLFVEGHLCLLGINILLKVLKEMKRDRKSVVSATHQY
jgi:hypothetical protein